MEELAIIILNWNGHQDTIECLESIRSGESQEFSIFILDNGSNYDSVKYIESWLYNSYAGSYTNLNQKEFNDMNDFSNSKLHFIRGDTNLGFAKGNNLIWNKIKKNFEYILLLNNDTTIDENSISNMLKYMKSNTNIGVLSCDIRFHNNKEKLWNAGGYFSWYGDRKYFKQRIIDKLQYNLVESISTPFITGCVMMIRKEVSVSVGVFTEKFFFGEEDFNYCKRLQNDKIKVETLLTSKVYHKVSSSIKKKQKDINRYILHFSNRIINFKEFYSPTKWYFWKQIYLLAIFLKILLITKKISVSLNVINHIKNIISKNNEITLETFNGINSISLE